MKKFQIFVYLSFVLLCIFSACQRPPVKEFTYYHDTTVFVTERVTVEVPKSSIAQPLNYDSLKQILSGMRPGERIIYRDQGNNTELSFFKNEYGKLVANCETLAKQRDLEIQNKNRIIEKYFKSEKPPDKPDQSWFNKLANNIGTIIIYLFFIAVAAFLYILYLKLRR
jgi:hypothetical protein